MAKYREKARVFEAWLNVEENAPVPGWVQEASVLKAPVTAGVQFTIVPKGSLAFEVVRPGDWVLRDGRGGVTACWPEHFAAVFEAID
jgi:hypothetical protein